MRVLEGTIVVLNLALITAPLLTVLKGRLRWFRLLVAATVVLVGAHLIWEGYRWQMIPLYVTSGVGVALGLRFSRGPALPKGWAITATASGAILVLIGTAALILLPVPRMPKPAGPYQIGTAIYHWVDESRAEIYGGADGTARRELMVQIWYPAEPEAGARPVRWLTNGRVTSRAMADFVDLPPWLVDQIALTESSAYLDAPIAGIGERLPVVLYIHGWGGFRNVNQDQLETLASLGYVVASADHVYGALVTVYPDGRTVYLDPGAMDGDGTEAGGQEAAEALVGVYADDAAFLLDRLEGLDQADSTGRFSGRLDLDRVGVFGHSTGGGAAVRLCAIDSRCRAVLGMDAWVEPVPDRLIDAGLSQPLMIMNSEPWEERENAGRQRLLVERSSGPAYWLGTAGTRHYDFVMVPSISPLAPALGMKGPLRGKRVVEINNRYLAAFFEQHLRGRADVLLDGPTTEFPEVTLEVLR